MKSWMLFMSIMLFNFLCLTFLASWTPLLSAICIVFMSLNICFLMVYLSSTSWFSYIMFLIFLGGLMVLFTYMCSVAPNEFTKAEPLKKLVYTLFYSLVGWTLMNWTMQSTDISTVKFIQFMIYSFNISLLLISIVYLLLTLLVAVNLSSYKYGPVRAKKN